MRFTVTYNNGPKAMEESKHFYLIPPTMESLPVRSVGVSADHKLSLPDEELEDPE